MVTNMAKRIAIIGLGWVGQPLAKQLTSEGHQVIGTTREEEKRQALRNKNLDAQLLLLSGDTTDFSKLVLNKFDAMVIAITPGFKVGATDYSANVEALVAHASTNNINQIILLSSTGVYTGKLGTVNEQSSLKFDIDKVSQLQQAEQAVLNYSGCHQVLRLAGLVGPNRLPGKFLAGKTHVSDPHTPINLIHQQDVVNIICRFISQPELSGVYNCVSPTISTRSEFYTQAAIASGLEPPTFVDIEETAKERNVCTQKLDTTLNYRFEYPDLLGWIKSMYNN